MPSSDIIEILVEFFAARIPVLHDTYQWKIPRIDGFHQLKNTTNIEQNIALKTFLKDQWEIGDFDDRIKLATWIVSSWGGIHGNKSSTINQYVKAVTAGLIPNSISGVASWSKIFAASDPCKFAIYDARVAASLNAIQIIDEPTRASFFPYLPGRNIIVGHSGKKIGFSYDYRFSKKSLIRSSSEWEIIKKKDTYQRYIQLLSMVLTKLPEYKMYHLEMTLFSESENLCHSLMN